MDSLQGIVKDAYDNGRYMAGDEIAGQARDEEQKAGA